jgi:signal recognition particle subunit SRP54
LFGSGKTSTAAKLARWYQTRGLRPALVCCDTARPAAYEQLQQLATQIGVPFYGEKMERNSATILRNALKNIKADVLIVDSSGRNALDPELIAEIKELDKILNPDERILVLPADIGQAAKTQAAAFQSALGITNIILTKLDATAKGGGALAACHATGAKIQFVTTGEKPDAIELYDPPRFVGRLIGMSDLETLLERAAAVAKPAVAEKIVSAKFDLNDFVEQMEATQQIGPFGQIAEMLGIGKKIPKELLEQQQAKIKKWKHILNSMTPTERSNPDIIDSARISRIARGSGVQEAEVRDLLAQYNKTKKMIKKLGITRTRGRDLAKLLKGFGM